jgi:hypothetical protein
VADHAAHGFFDLSAVEKIGWDDCDIAALLHELIMRALQFAYVTREQSHATTARANLPR